MHGEEKKECKAATVVSIAGRIIGLGLAVAAAALMATASQCTVYVAYGARPRTVTYGDFPAFVYLVGAAAIATFLEAIAVFLCLWKKGRSKLARVLMPLLAAAVPALLYTAAGAGFAAADDMPYCSAYGKRVGVCAGSAFSFAGVSSSSNFCSQVRISVYLALAAAIAVSLAEVVRGLGLGGSPSAGDCDSDSSSDSGGCDHGCHHKH